MKQWFEEKLSDEALRPVHSHVLDDLSLTVYEYDKPCGHPGFFVELFVRDHDEDIGPVVCLGGESLPDAVRLMYEALDYVTKRTVALMSE